MIKKFNPLKLKLKHKHIDIYYFPNPGSNTLKIVKNNIYFGEKYCHTLHSNPIVAKKIFEIIDKI